MNKKIIIGNKDIIEISKNCNNKLIPLTKIIKIKCIHKIEKYSRINNLNNLRLEKSIDLLFIKLDH